MQTQETKNDGIIHGKFLRRAKVDGLTRETFSKLLRIGSVFNVFSRGIHLYACDEATRVRSGAVLSLEPDGWSSESCRVSLKT
jgi:hypothetical protein